MTSRRLLAPALLALAFGLAACVPDEGPAMRPGEDCLSCHNGDRAGAWTVAGTVYGDPNAAADQGQEGAQVIVTDDVGKVLTLTSNSVGNFYTAESVTFPITIVVQRGSARMVMQEQQDTGACNLCHNIPIGEEGVPGRVFVPFSTSAASRKPASLLRTALRKS